MGFFAVLDDAKEPKDFVIQECHVNLWSLAGMIGGRCFLWDIGLRIQTGVAPLSAIRVALPSGGADGGITDLTQLLHARETAELIFGKPVQVSDKTIDYGNGPATLIEVNAADSSLDALHSTPEFSVWNISLAMPCEAGSVCYFRFRIHATAIGRCWTWRRSWLEQKRILLDFRVSDIRELWYLKERHTLKHAIHDINCLRFFLVVPAKFRLAATSPPTFYSRLLEGYAWKTYLQRLPNLFHKEKLVIHQWRNDPVINLERPLRIFADMDDPRILTFGPNMLMGLCILLAVGLLIAGEKTVILKDSSSLSRHIVSIAKEHIPATSFVALTLLAFKLLGKVAAGKKLFHQIRNWLVKLERTVYSKLPTSDN